MKKGIIVFLKNEAPLVVFFLLFIGLRIGYLMAGGVAIDSDEAIVGLMGRHVLTGKHVAFFYGQEYMGSLEAYVAALLFMLFGASSWSLKLAPFIFAVLFFIFTVHLARALYDRRTSLITALLLVFSSTFFLLWSVKARGGYIETLFFGTVLLLLAHKMLLYAPSCRPEALENGSRVLRVVFNSLLVLIGAILCIQVVRGGFSLQVGDLSISSRGLIRPLSALFIIWLTGYIACRGKSVRLSELVTPYWRTMALFGFVTGLSWWTNQLILFYLLPIGCVLAWRLRSTVRSGEGQLYFLATFVPLFFLGSFPHWLYGIIHGFSTEGVTGLAPFDKWFLQGVQFFQIGLPVLLGCKFDFQANPLVAGCSVAVLVVYILALLFLVTRLSGRFSAMGKSRQDTALELIFFLFLLFSPILFSISSMGWYIEEPRYLLPLVSVLPIVAAAFLSQVLEKSRTIFFFLIVPFVLLSVFGVATADIALFQPFVQKRQLPADFAPLMRLLQEKKINRLYANYWIGYRVVFESREEIISSVYPPMINERYPPYAELVKQADNPAYVTMWTRSAAFEGMLADMKISRYSRTELYPFILYHDLEIDNDEWGESLLLLNSNHLVSQAGTENMERAVDGDLATRWQYRQGDGQDSSFQLDLGEVTPVKRLDLLLGYYYLVIPSSSLKIEVSEQGEEWLLVRSYEETKDNLCYRQVFNPLGTWLARLSVDLGGRQIRFVRLSPLKDDAEWSIAEIELYR